MPDKDILPRARRRFEQAKSAWSELREDYSQDARYINVLGGQWDKKVKDARESNGKPALEFNELHTHIQSIINRARQNRPSPRVEPGDDDAQADTAKLLAGRLRHLWYASQGDIASDTAVECAATGGFGFYAITSEYIDDGTAGGQPSFAQEPRIKRILDPLSEYPDPNAKEPDLSDAEYWFSRQWMDREKFKSEFGTEAVEFLDEHTDWATEDQVAIAQYWEVQHKTRKYVLLQGAAGPIATFEDELPEDFDLQQYRDAGMVINERDVDQRSVCCYLIDGERVLETNKWLGKWIPRVAVLGREAIVDGKRYLISAVRFARDPQKLKNAYKSNIAHLLAISSTAPWIGPEGTFKDRKWLDANVRNYSYLEYTPILVNGVLQPPPARNTYEAPIQALTASAMQVGDDIKRAVGYTDQIQPSQTELSGIAVKRRTEQADLVNYHFEDNLKRSHYHAARILLDLDMALTDTPRPMRAQKEDGSTYVEPVTMDGPEGYPTAVPGYEQKPHHRMDIGRYDISITTGPSYNTQLEEQRDILLSVAQGNPAAWSIYGDLIFKAMGYPELEERAKMALLPAIQQALQSGEKIPPQAQAMVMQLQQRLEQAIQQLQTLLFEKEAKLIDNRTKTEIALIKAETDMTVQSMKHDHEKRLAFFDEQMRSVEQRLNMLHDSELTPDPNAPPAKATS